MKLRLQLILCCLCCWFGPWVGVAISDAELIEQYPLGQINWTRGVVTAPIANDFDPKEGQIPDQAIEQAVQNVINTLMQLRVDDQRCASHILEDNQITRAKVEAMARFSKVIHHRKSPSGGEEISVQMSLHGGFSQLMLPSEIRQVQPIIALNSAFHRRNSENAAKDSSNNTPAEPEAFTGLIVDARGTGANPSMVPTLIDEKGQEVFGTAYVSREFAVQHGLCQYIRLMPGEWSAFERVAPNPLKVKGLRTAMPNSCKIVISNADASKLRGTSTHLEFMKQCRVIIVLD